jgi:hypothetical protein
MSEPLFRTVMEFMLSENEAMEDLPVEKESSRLTVFILVGCLVAFIVFALLILAAFSS